MDNYCSIEIRSVWRFERKKMIMEYEINLQLLLLIITKNKINHLNNFTII